MAKIVIANPPWYYNENNEWRFGVRSGSRWPFTVGHEKDFLNRYRPFPFWLTYAHSLLKQNEINSVFIDSITRGDTYSQFYRSVLYENPEFVFFEISTPSFLNDITVAKELHAHGIKVLVGGTHATVFAETLIEEKCIYAVFKGEYEFALLDFMKQFETPGIKESVPFDIDTLPFPYRDENVIWQYRERTHGYTPFQISILTSRGCPYGCIFCQWPKVIYSGKVRFRSISSIHEEIKMLVDKFGNNIHIYVDDETFDIDEKRSIEISKIFARYNLQWSAMCRIDTISLSAWETLYNNGLKYVNVGIESASPKVLKSINKKLDIVKAEEAINFLHKIGMKVHLTFTFGAPGETEEDIALTKQFYDRVKVASKQTSRCIPLPGSQWWESLDNKNINYDGYKTLEQKL
jgi:radical SAM superfamily enzyme YgiQ (UPF0313 family)